MRGHSLAIGWVITLCAAIAPFADAAMLYHVNMIPANEDVSVQGINNYGQVTGIRLVPTGFTGFIWTPTTPNGITGTRTTLPTLVSDPEAYGSAGAVSINDGGQVSGYSSGDFTGSHATLWSPTTPNGTNGSMVDLGPLPGGGQYTRGEAINASGQVAGWGLVSNSSAKHAFVWSPDSPNGSTGTMVDIGDLPGGDDSGTASGINSYGQVVGNGTNAAGSQPFLWQPASPNSATGVMLELVGLSATSASKINSSGQVIASGSGAHAYRWTPFTPNGTTGSAIDLGVLSGQGRNISLAMGLNIAGDVVGYSEAPSASYRHAFLYTDAGGMVDLNGVLDSSGAGWELIEARVINDAGQIAGLGLFDPPGPTGPQSRSFLLTPTTLIPEPAVATSLIGPTFILALRLDRGRRRTAG